MTGSSSAVGSPKNLERVAYWLLTASLGMTLFNATPEESREIHAGLVAGLDNGTLNPVVGKEFPLADAVKAHVAVMESGAYGKIVLVP